MLAKQLTVEEVYDAYTDAWESFEDVKASLDELQIELDDQVSGFTAVLDEVRDQLEQCRRQFRQFSRRVNPRYNVIKELSKTEQHEESALDMLNFYSEDETDPVLPFEEP